MANWSFLTNHAWAVLHLADQPETRLVDLASALGVTERTASTIVAELIVDGYVVKQRIGRRNRYLINEQLPLPETPSDARPTVQDLLRLFDRR